MIRRSAILALPLVLLLGLPILALLLSTSPSDFISGVQHPSFAPAVWLSLRTSL
ncbi:MAG: ABC-type sulfate transport system permease component, partial [Myxococcota bacterium]